MDKKQAKTGDKVFLKFDPKKQTPEEIAEIMKQTRAAARKAAGLPPDDEE